MPQLIVADVDHIQSYIFGSSQLRAVRGGSLLVEKLGEEFKNLIEPKDSAPIGKCLRWQGGQMVGRFDNPDELALKQLCAALLQTTRKLGGPALTIKVGVVSYQPPAFGAAMQAAIAAIEHQKEAGDAAFPLRAGGFVRPCALCRQFPATLSYNFAPADAEKKDIRDLCKACEQRVKYREVASHFENTLRGALPSGWDVPTRLDNFEEFRLLALLTADGNGLGQMLQSFDDEALYANFSQALGELFPKSLAQAAQSLKDEPKGLLAPENCRLLPIIAGGDDVSVFLPAAIAPDFAHAWQVAFEELSQKDEHIQRGIAAFRAQQPVAATRLYPDPGPAWPLKLGFGLVMVKPHFPINFAQTLARELRHEAKRLLAPTLTQPAPKNQSVIDFTLLTTAGAEKLGDLRARYQLTTGVTYHLTMRPYSAEAFAQLLALRQALIKIPRHQRKFLYAEFWRGPQAAELAWQQVTRRLNTKNKEKITRPLNALVGQAGLFNAKNRTPLVDALELAELLPAAKEA
jgi:hypothetical protein